MRADKVYEQHAPAVYRYLARRAGPGVAEDLLGDVFVAALSTRTRTITHDSGSPLPWLYGIAGNMLRNHFRRRRPVVPLDTISTVDWDAVDARLDAQALGDPLRRALAALSDNERELLLLVAWEGLSPAEAGTALGLSANTARSRLHRARTHAQQVLESITSDTSGRTR